MQYITHLSVLINDAQLLQIEVNKYIHALLNSLDAEETDLF